MTGADITGKQSATGSTTKALTDAEGKYSLSSLAPGLYEIVVRQAGVDDAARAVDLAAGANVDQSFTLSLGARSDSASVDARLSAVPTKNPGGQTIMSAVQDDFKNRIATLSTSGVIYSGPPRSFYGGARIKLVR